MRHNTTRADLFGRTIRGHTVLRISGEPDIVSTAATGSPPSWMTTGPRVIIDLSRVWFCDA